MKIHGANRTLRNERGSIAVISAIYLVALFMMITLLIDSATVISSKRSMQASLDIAALSGAKMLADDSISDDTLKSQINWAFKENIKTTTSDLICDPTESEFDRDKGDVSVDVSCMYAPMLGGTIAPEDVEVKVRSKTLISQRKLDVAMVLDASGSMNSSGKLGALKTASKLAAKTLIEAGRPGDNRVSFVAYSKTVNILQYGPYAWEIAIRLNPCRLAARHFSASPSGLETAPGTTAHPDQMPIFHLAATNVRETASLR